MSGAETDPKGEFAFFDVTWEDDSQRPNRRVPAELLGRLRRARADISWSRIARSPRNPAARRSRSRASAGLVRRRSRRGLRGASARANVQMEVGMTKNRIKGPFGFDPHSQPRHCERSEAIQSYSGSLSLALDCFASLARTDDLDLT
jgi:hypothetical protein